MSIIRCRHHRPTSLDRKIQCAAQHFRRQSLYSTGLKNPDDIIQHCLTLFRQADPLQIAPYLTPPSSQSAISGAVHGHMVGNSIIYEQGPLASLAEVLDCSARRVLPGHLLRRSRVLGSLYISHEIFQQRISLSAKHGEEGIFVFTLYKREILEVDSQNESILAVSMPLHDDTSGDESDTIHRKRFLDTAAMDGDVHHDDILSTACWLLQAVCADTTTNAGPPITPHPKTSPQSVVLAQLLALQQGNIFEASIFGIWETNNIKTGGRRPFALGQNFEILRDIVQDQQYHPLLHCEEFILGPSAVPTQNSMLQEVAVKGKGSTWKRFVWRLSMQRNGCWMTVGIVPVLESF